jgi:hypothetical protein
MGTADTRNESTERVDAVSMSPSTSLFGIDRLRRGMISAGVPSEFAAVAAGMAADYASKAYTHGYDRGFLDGIDWQKARMPNDEFRGGCKQKDC